MEFSAVLDNHFGFTSLQVYLIIANRLQSFKWKLLNESVLKLVIHQQMHYLLHFSFI
jgi:hypothetical protein